jgi:hypothetical protein
MAVPPLSRFVERLRTVLLKQQSAGTDCRLVAIAEEQLFVWTCHTRAWPWMAMRLSMHHFTRASGRSNLQASSLG